MPQYNKTPKPCKMDTIQNMNIMLPIGYQTVHYNPPVPKWPLDWYKLVGLLLLQKKCEEYWPDDAEVPFVPAPGSPLTVTYKSVMPFAEYIIRKMVVAHVSLQRGMMQGPCQYRRGGSLNSNCLSVIHSDQSSGRSKGGKLIIQYVWTPFIHVRIIE